MLIMQVKGLRFGREIDMYMIKIFLLDNSHGTVGSQEFAEPSGRKWNWVELDTSYSGDIYKNWSPQEFPVPSNSA